MGQFLNLFLCLSIIVISLSGCAQFTTEPQSKPERHLIPVNYSEVTGWKNDKQNEVLKAYKKSCDRILKLSPDRDFGIETKVSDWVEPCKKMPPLTVSDNDARIYFETWFNPYVVKSGDENTGLFTGYYEASLRGAETQTGVYQTPIRARPNDLVMVNLGEFVPDLKGQRIAGRVKDGQLKPYEDRASIEAGQLPKNMDVPLYWVDSPVDAFFLQIQGSGVISLPNGQTQRVGYDGQNGHPYTAIGKELIARGALTKDTVSMQSIREWLASHPIEAIDVMRTNKSYVFFRKLDTEGPIGGEGTILTPERSLAIDSSIWPYGIPMFIAIDHPLEGRKIEKLMVAQDTGGAIKGIIRGDFFWGYGEIAAQHAGPMKSKGKLWILLPKSVGQ